MEARLYVMPELRQRSPGPGRLVRALKQKSENTSRIQFHRHPRFLSIFDAPDSIFSLHPRSPCGKDTPQSRLLCWLSAQRGACMQLKLIVRTIDDIVIVDCNGRIVFGEESADLRDTVRMVITQSKRVILNLSGVTYIDSGGLGTLVALYTTARNNGGAIKLANLTQRVGDLLQVTKLVTIFDVYDSEEKALESFRKAA